MSGSVGAVLVGAALVWAMLIMGWWLFWQWYGREHGGLQPTSWHAILTMPVWSVQSIWHGWREKRKRETVAKIVTALDTNNHFERLHEQLRQARNIPESKSIERRCIAEALDQGLRDAPPGIPVALRDDFENTIRILRGDEA